MILINLTSCKVMSLLHENIFHLKLYKLIGLKINQFQNIEWLKQIEPKAKAKNSMIHTWTVDKKWKIMKDQIMKKFCFYKL